MDSDVRRDFGGCAQRGTAAARIRDERCGASAEQAAHEQHAVGGRIVGGVRRAVVDVQNRQRCGVSLNACVDPGCGKKDVIARSISRELAGADAGERDLMCGDCANGWRACWRKYHRLRRATTGNRERDRRPMCNRYSP